LRPCATSGDEPGDVLVQPSSVLAPDFPPNTSRTPGTPVALDARGGAGAFGIAAQHATSLAADHVAAPSLFTGPVRPGRRAMVRPYRSFVPVGRADGVQKDRSMDENSAFAAIAALISTQFSVSAREIRPETRLADLALDSIGLVELAALLEDEFDVDVTATAITMQDSIGDLVRRLCVEPRPPTAR
jgi:acyl carrier protein